MLRLAVFLLSTTFLFGAERSVDPTFLHRFISDAEVKPSDLSTDSCHYKPLFGEGDSVTSIVKGVARYGELTIDPKGTCLEVAYPGEEQVYFLLEGNGVLHYGNKEYAVGKNDFIYLAPGVKRRVSNRSTTLCRLMVMGFKIPQGVLISRSDELMVANTEEVKKQTVGGHPPSVLYQLLMGDRQSTRDKIAAGQILTSLFIMEFKPGGTNFPHHHEAEEEIYLILDGEGEIVAGGGQDGIEGRHAAKAGDAFFFRLNCTVGFYSSSEPGGKARILAVRSLFPRPDR